MRCQKAYGGTQYSGWEGWQWQRAPDTAVERGTIAAPRSQTAVLTPLPCSSSHAVASYAQVQALEKVLGDARAKISSLKATVADQKRQLDAVHMQLQARGHEDARLEQLRVQLTSAFQGGLRGGAHRLTSLRCGFCPRNELPWGAVHASGQDESCVASFLTTFNSPHIAEELRVAQQRGDMHEELARGLTAEVIKLKELLARREQELRDMQERQAQAKHQVRRLATVRLKRVKNEATGCATAAAHVGLPKPPPTCIPPSTGGTAAAGGVQAAAVPGAGR